MYKQTDDGSTLFQLAKGTKLQFGSETIVLNERTDVLIHKSLSRESIAETLFGAGAASSAELLAYNDGDVLVTYGVGGRRIETPIEPEPEVAEVPKKTAAKPKK